MTSDFKLLRMMKHSIKSFIFFSLLLIGIKGFNQNITVSDLKSLLKEKNWSGINNILISKGWQFYKSDSETSSDYGKIVWGFEYDGKNKSQCWISVNTSNDLPIRITLQFSDDDYYLRILDELDSKKFSLYKTEIKSSEILAKYSDLESIIELSSKNSFTQVSFSPATKDIHKYALISYYKGSKYDQDNGDFIDYFDDGKTPKMKYKKIDGKINGKVTEFNENGKIISEHFEYEDTIKGIYKIFVII